MHTVAALFALAMGLGLSTLAPSPAERQKAVPRPSVAPPGPVVLWHVDGEGHGRPAADSDTVYFLSARHEVLALDMATGALRWTQRTGEAGESTAGSALTIAGPVVVAGDYNLVALDRATGSVRWRFVPAVGYAPGLYLGEARPDLVFAGSPSGRLYGIAATTGELRWTAAVDESSASTVFAPTTDGHIVVAGYTVFGTPHRGGVVCLDATTGQERWRAPFPRARDPLLGTGSTGGPIIAGHVVVASSGDGTIHAFDSRTGSPAWTLPPDRTVPPALRGPFPRPPSSSGPDYRPLAKSDDLLFAGSLTGDVVAYDLTTRRERWRHLDGADGSVAFALSSDRRSVYVPFASGRHVALAMDTGAPRWRTEDMDEGFSWPSLSIDARLFMAGRNGGFVALRQ